MKLRRRRVPRQATEWFGKCLIEDDCEAVWSECRVIDISILGAGVEVFAFEPRDLVGHRLVVEVQPPDASSLSVNLVGEIRNMSVAPRRRVRLGIEFVDLSDNERSIVDMLARMQMTW
jgi:PilZ domain-containing protein